MVAYSADGDRVNRATRRFGATTWAIGRRTAGAWPAAGGLPGAARRQARAEHPRVAARRREEDRKPVRRLAVRSGVAAAAEEGDDEEADRGCGAGGARDGRRERGRVVEEGSLVPFFFAGGD